MTDRMRFGVFHAPYHLPMGQNPTLSLQRDIEFIQHLDRLGIDPLEQRNALEEDTDVLKRLLAGETVSIKTDRYTLVEARTQLRPYSDFEVAVAAVASPTGPRIAGRYGAGILSIGATMSALAPDGVDTLGLHWSVMEEVAAKYGQVADRSKWRLVGPMHIAETREQAREDVKHGIDAWFDYFQDVQSATHFEVAGKSTEERTDFVIDSGLGVIGTPDDAVEQISKLHAQSKGGFGAYLVMTHEWADVRTTEKSYELMAERVFPAFQDSVGSLQASAQWASTERSRLGGEQMKSVLNAMEKHKQEMAAGA